MRHSRTKPRATSCKSPDEGSVKIVLGAQDSAEEREKLKGGLLCRSAKHDLVPHHAISIDLRHPAVCAAGFGPQSVIVSRNQTPATPCRRATLHDIVASKSRQRHTALAHIFSRAVGIADLAGFVPPEKQKLACAFVRVDLGG